MKSELIICSWNIKKGLIKREEELKEMLKSENIDIIFISETDTKELKTEADYQIAGYKTIFQKRKTDSNILRIICLIKDEIAESITTLDKIMSVDIPSIWIEFKDQKQMKTAIGSFYREWTHEGIKSDEEQTKNMGLFCQQIEACANKYNNLITLGDMNLCSDKWKEDNFLYKNIASALIDTLEQCGLKERKLGNTFTADGVNKNGNTVSSSLDHIYLSEDLERKTTTSKLLASSSDHLPILAKILRNGSTTKRYKVITKRSTKNFTQTRWCETIQMIQRRKLDLDSDDMEQNAKSLGETIEEALNICAPLKTFKVRENHKFGISENTKKVIKERDFARQQIKDKSPTERVIQHQKYKSLRNRVNSLIKSDTIKYNNDRIEKAEDENEIWKIVNEVTNPKSESKWTLEENGEKVEDDLKIAEIFNEFFINKIKDIKDNIDQTKVEDPFIRLEEKMKEKNLKFSLKVVTEKTVEKAIKGLRMKRSAGADSLTQEQLKLGSKELTKPLTKIINKSITEGKFPEEWKKAIVTPVLKKGSAKDKNNYRPVSCLMVLSKVLEKVVCSQITEFMENNDLLPENQHGFRQYRSTMSAHANIQQEWNLNTEKKLITGVLLWDLSAAFDCLDSDILCRKLAIYGFCVNSVNWIRSFLTGRSQQVKINNTLSTQKNLTSGVPQGGILSPILFVIYGADIEAWLKHSTAHTYADDTKTSVTAKTMEEMKLKLEEDARRVLRFMASNGLKANPNKTTLLIINGKKEEDTEINIDGEVVHQDHAAKLLGLTIEDSQKWDKQISGKGGVIPSLNTRLYLIKRMKNKVNLERLKKVANGIWTSKLRYGLQMYAKVRVNSQDPYNANMEKLQVSQNKLTRVLENVTILDRIPTATLLNKQKMLSVNQIAAQIKLTELWKACNIPKFPIKITRQSTPPESRQTRGVTKGRLLEPGTSNLSVNSFIGDATRLWNRAPETVTNSETLYKAKIEIKKFVQSLPI